MNNIETELTVAVRQVLRYTRARWPRDRSPRLELRVPAHEVAPGVEYRRRVVGGDAVRDREGQGFIRSGYDDLRTVINVAEVFGVDFARPIQILDWGVGCGRMIRHWPAVQHAMLHGADVDPVNIQWCQANLTFGTYLTIDPFAPMAYETGSFDLIYSHSVFTHLSVQDQDFWLSELGRVCKPDGLVIASVHGLYSNSICADWFKEPEGLLRYLRRGFIDADQANPDIADVTPPDYYRDVAHTPRYVFEHWSTLVDVVDIVAGGFGPMHDAVLFRPRKA